jgi:hypothetical protein
MRLSVRQTDPLGRGRRHDCEGTSSSLGMAGLFAWPCTWPRWSVRYRRPQHPNFHLERCPRPKQICDHPNNEPDKISHPARASPHSRSTASQIEFATGTGDYGWPECYHDQDQKKLVLAPEYGGDGGKTVGVCASKQAPVAAFSGHWAPNDLLIYTGAQFPEPYRDGAFIAFHGSWRIGEVLALRKAFFQIMGASRRALRPKPIGSEMRANSSEASRE